MSTKKLSKLKGSFQSIGDWYNSLEHNKQISILEFLNNGNVDNNLTKDDLTYLNELVLLLPKLVVDINDEKKVLTFFEKCGFEQIVSKSLLDYAIDAKIPYGDAKIVKSLTAKRLEETMNFIITKMIIYEDYQVIPFEVFQGICGFKEEEAAHSVLRFIKSQIYSVLDRQFSLETIKHGLQSTYDLKDEQINIIIDGIRENLQQMQQAYLIRQLNDLLSQFSDFAATCETKCK